MTQDFALADPPSAPIAGSERRYPVARIFCIGRNYADHAREMGSDGREPPFFFTKWASALVPGGGTIPYPPQTEDYQFEAELVLAIETAGASIRAEDALAHVFGYAVGLDMTRRDLQRAAREQRKPWDAAKNFSHAAPIAPIRPVAAGGHVTAGRIRLEVNGATRQEGDVADMIWSTAEIVAHLSRFERLSPGDLIYTGTPAGVGAVVPGDVLDATVDGLAPLRVTIGPRETAFA